MCWWLSRSASSAPYASTRLQSRLSGRSTEVDTFSPGAVCPSICLRMDSTAACERRNRFASALSSRSSPSSKCSVSIFGLNIRTAELAGLIATEEDGSPGLFSVALEHFRTLLQNDGGRRKARARLRYGLVSGREVGFASIIGTYN